MLLRIGVILAASIGLLPLSNAGAGLPCTIDVSTAPTPPQLVERAASILHVRARGYCGGADRECSLLANSIVVTAGPQGAPGPASWSSGNTGTTKPIDFEVLEVLKGPAVPGVVRILGTLVDQDDFNEQPVPFTFVRRGGRSGNCFAFGYRSDREYLLFLRPGKESLTPYWAPLAPINEQIRGSQDPWVTWVKRQVGSR